MPINDMTDLRRELCEVIETVKKDRRYVPQATEIINASGKIINSLRVEMEYYKLAKESLPKKNRLMLAEKRENPMQGDHYGVEGDNRFEGVVAFGTDTDTRNLDINFGDHLDTSEGK